MQIAHATLNKAPEIEKARPTHAPHVDETMKRPVNSHNEVSTAAAALNHANDARNLNRVEIAPTHTKSQQNDNVVQPLEELPTSHHLEAGVLKAGFQQDELLTLKNIPTENLTPHQIDQLKTVRESIPMLTSDTMMQKVLPKCDIAKYLSGQYISPSGFVAKNLILQAYDIMMILLKH